MDRPGLGLELSNFCAIPGLIACKLARWHPPGPCLVPPSLDLFSGSGCLGLNPSAPRCYR
jgi:hypothetical protein